jgi:hypothetical protein
MIEQSDSKGQSRFADAKVSKETRTRPQSIMLIGRRWFEKTNGNTYHSVSIYVDGKPIGKVDFRYGYGDQWQWTGCEWLERNGYLPGIEHFKNGGSESIWRYCERHGITFSSEVTDVQRKKDL